MHVLHHLRPRLILLSRAIMWVAIGLIAVVGLFVTAPAWAQDDPCAGNGTTGGVTIPISPQVRYLIYGGPPQTYEVSLCKDPTAPVSVTAVANPNNLISISPASFSLNSTVPQIVSISVLNSHNRRAPFKTVITHSATSADPFFDWGTLKVPTVTAYYSPPVALLDIAVTRVGQAVDIPVMNNDTDRLGQGLHLGPNAIVIPPNRGTATVNSNNIHYSPGSARTGVTLFAYQVDDAIGNTDNAAVAVLIVPAFLRNLLNLFFSAIDGTNFTNEQGYDISIPSVKGAAPDATVTCAFGDAATTSGDLAERPIKPSSFTGVAFYLQCYVDGEPVTEDMLASPVEVFVPLGETFQDAYGNTILSVANWEEIWRTAGVEILPDSNSTLLHIRTTLLGEFAVFSTSENRFPALFNNNVP